MTAPAFGHEIERSFPVHPHCFDCVEFYAGCPAWPASRGFACREYSLLPVLGIDGQTGQMSPPSRMGGRISPQGLPPVSATEARQTPAIETPAKPLVGKRPKAAAPDEPTGVDPKMHMMIGVWLEQGTWLANR